MQTCIENSALPLLEPAPPPLPERAPTWTIRVARPISTHRHELAGELRGVPKAALRHVFGKVLGTRLWQQNRTTATPAPASAKPAPVLVNSDHALIPDAEISGGMLRHLCSEAAATLRERKRRAKSITLTLQYHNGESETAHQLLLQSTNDPRSLEAAAHAAIRGMRSDAFVALKLDLTATQA